MKEIIDSIRKKYMSLDVNKIGYIDIDSIDRYCDNPKVLYYLFPVIEKVLLEILKCYPFASPEIKNQGSYRPMNSLLNDDFIVELEMHLPSEMVRFLKDVYGNNGLRDKLFHGETWIFCGDYKEVIKNMLASLETLLDLYKDISEDDCFDKIKISFSDLE